MEQQDQYKEYSIEKVIKYKEDWNKDFSVRASLIDLEEIVFILIGLLVFLFSPIGFKVVFIVALILFYWFKVKQVEGKIITAKQYLVLGEKYLSESFKGRGVTEGGAKPHYDSHRHGFGDYIDFLDTQRNHLVARMVILNLFALVLLATIKN
ncbi:MAG: hypothetical protein AAB539_00665 [Patescibacteria group bacterium]